MEIYDCHEFAERLNVSEIWIRELARRGRIVPAKKAAGRWLFFHNSVTMRPPDICRAPAARNWLWSWKKRVTIGSKTQARMKAQAAWQRQRGRDKRGRCQLKS